MRGTDKFVNFGELRVATETAAPASVEAAGGMSSPMTRRRALRLGALGASASLLGVSTGQARKQNLSRCSMKRHWLRGAI